MPEGLGKDGEDVPVPQRSDSAYSPRVLPLEDMRPISDGTSRQFSLMVRGAFDKTQS